MSSPIFLPVVRLLGVLHVDFFDLLVQGQGVVHVTDTKESAGEQVQNAGEDLSHVEAVDTKETEEQMETPGNGVIDPSRLITSVCLLGHAGNQEQINDPADRNRPKVKNQSAPVSGLPK